MTTFTFLKEFGQKSCIYSRHVNKLIGLGTTDYCRQNQGEIIKTYYVYILANKTRGCLYIGITGDLISRISQHKQGLSYGFSKKYKLKKLVYFERFDNPNDAIAREKRMKKWERTWKIKLIEKHNPSWRDLYPEITFT
ncbi:MAG: hypothetical protein GF392_01090 [Candidatus Omnitrophica bacterium]|nr:hypothetical protein [Candidatus Omnitrophota bacterium]